MKHGRKLNEKGMVAIIVTMIMMFVITLIVLGFSEVTRRNQREALDSQLGLQAYYAAETGVNDVTSSLKAGYTVAQNSACVVRDSNGTSYPRSYIKQSGTDKTVQNTCLIVNSTPTTLVAGSIKPASDSVVWHVKNGDGENFTAFKFAWGKGAGTGDCSAQVVGKYPAADAWNCSHALLRVDILKGPVADTTAAGLANVTSSFYMQPGKTDVQIPVATLGSPAAYQGSCNIPTTGPTADVCEVTVNLNGASAGEYYVRITSMYDTASQVTLSAKGTTHAMGKAHFTDGQIVVDSTGRAQDQLKRIQVRILPNAAPPTVLPVYGVQSADTICKQLSLAPGQYDKGACGSTWPVFNVPAVANGSGGSGTNSGPGGGTDSGRIGNRSSSGTVKILNTPSWGLEVYVLEEPSTAVLSCVWHWGDNTTTSESAANCHADDASRETHYYPQTPACTPYTAYMTFNLVGGGSIDTQGVTKFYPWIWDDNGKFVTCP